MKQLTLEMINIPKALEKQSSVTYDVRMLKGKNIDFDVVLDSGCALQRGFCWTLEQKQELIMSMIKEINIPNLYIYDYTDEEGNITLKVIDGKQRISALLDYYNGLYPIVVDGVDYYFKDLHSWVKSRIAGRPITTIIFYGYYDDKLSDNDLIDIFNYVNFTGTPQDKTHMEYLLSFKS